MTVSIKSPTSTTGSIQLNGSDVLTIESDRSVDIDSGTLHVDAANNRVGIGTSSPANLLDIISSLDPVMRITSSGSGPNTGLSIIKEQGSGDLGNWNAININGNDNVSYESRIQWVFDSISNGPVIGGKRTGSGETQLAFHTNSGETLYERMRINSSGVVTMPYQPAFAVTGNSGTVTVSAGAAVPFNNEYYDNGNNFNPSTYQFTAPVAGTYYFNASIYIQGGVSICFYKNGSQYANPTPLIKISGSDQFDTSNAMSIILNLAANDTVAVHSRGTQSSIVYTPHSMFSGFLIG